MATYNGEAHVEAQIASILDDLNPCDELVIYDDRSTDGTVDLLRLVSDPRVRVQVGAVNVGHVRAFEQTLQSARGELIALADQDDLWPLGRTAALATLLEDVDLAVGNYRTFGADERAAIHPLVNEMFASGSPRNLAKLGLGRLSYFGSAMMLRRTLLERVLPIPPWVEAHDQWIGVVANVRGAVRHTDEVVTLRRLHGANLTPAARRSWSAVLKTRGIQARMMLTAVAR
ncbi:glycosyltransferase [Knoellia sp. CPCC 206453]|uniref:glycosyltransferase n=1 Tax=Knoellia pratensis TaxID=3404796 RepID=UPI003619C1AE